MHKAGIHGLQVFKATTREVELAIKPVDTGTSPLGSPAAPGPAPQAGGAHPHASDEVQPPSTEPRSADGYEKWFDDVGLEDSDELEIIRQEVSEITLKIPDSNHDIRLVELVNSVNRPSNNRDDQRHDISKLEDYLEHLAQDKVNKERAKNSETEIAAKLAEIRQKNRSPLLQKVHRVTKVISSSMKNVFREVLKMLKGGLKPVLETVAFIAGELTFQTHYQVALKAILLLVTAYDSANELTDEITLLFDTLDKYGQEMRALQEGIKSAPMSKAISKLFVSIVRFIVAAGSYMKHGMLPKMIISIGGRKENLQELLKSVKGDYDEVKRVMEFAQVMINLKNLQQTYKLREDTTIIIRQDKELRLLNNSVPSEMPAQLREVHDHTRFHAELHIQTLRAELFRDSVYEPLEEMAFNNRERIFLSSHDRWQRQFKPFWTSNASESTLISKAHTTYRPLMWITGYVSRRNISWVSSLSVDLIPYFRNFSNFNVAYIFCKRGQGPRYTPTLIIKGLVAQLMDAYPTIAVKNLRRLSLDRFCKIGSETKPGSAVLAWELLQDTLRLMEEAPELRNRAVLILIDRLDLCVSEKGFSVMEGLLPRLQNLSHQRSRVQVIVTTARLSALTVPTLRRGFEWLQAYGKKTHG